MVPWAYYTNLRDSIKFPIITPDLFKKNCELYNKSMVLDTNNYLDPGCLLIVQAVTAAGSQRRDRVLIGYLLSDHAVANVAFKTYGYNVEYQALNFVSSLKLGHYVKIPPRAIFMAQIASSVISCIGFLLGAILPLLLWSMSKKFLNVHWLKYVHWPVLVAATSNMRLTLPYMYSNGLFVQFIFAFLVRRYRYDWWARYNYLTSAALDTGVMLSGLIIS
ncbi:hypothetical protein EDD11_002156 [Mortierella claussenii]|nr:hypothetical protein EDD11_002156 [Mortierella claussenii]